mmetsp:Transcript_13134/g.21309  ORF Transcript_13134/g.21309 Transcript_13134/m.21309 type:complete len:344 (-) Transcript_13134:314-1345(-)
MFFAAVRKRSSAACGCGWVFARNLATQAVSNERQAPDDFCVDLVRNGDKHGYLAGMFVPLEARKAYFAVRALNIELARVKDAVGSNDQIGRMRFQWWREGIDAIYSGSLGQFGGNPVIKATAAAVGKHELTRRWLDKLVDAREDDLFLYQPQSLEDMETYAEQTASSLMYLGLEMVGIREDSADHVASHVGKATGLASALNGLPYVFEAGQLRLPRDLMVKHGLRGRGFAEIAEDRRAGRKPDSRRPSAMTEEEKVQAYSALIDVTFEIASLAHGHLEHARTLTEKVPTAGRLMFLPVTPASRFLTRLESHSFDILDPKLRNDPFAHLSLVYQLGRHYYAGTF